MKDLENFLIDENASLKDALVKIKNNKSRHVFVTLKETQKIINVKKLIKTCSKLVFSPHGRNNQFPTRRSRIEYHY